MYNMNEYQFQLNTEYVVSLDIWQNLNVSYLIKQCVPLDINVCIPFSFQPMNSIDPCAILKKEVMVFFIGLAIVSPLG